MESYIGERRIKNPYVMGNIDIPQRKKKLINRAHEIQKFTYLYEYLSMPDAEANRSLLCWFHQDD